MPILPEETGLSVEQRSGGSASVLENAAHRTLWTFDNVAAILLFLLILGNWTFSGHEIIVDANDGTVFYVEKSWWGFARKEREIRWMKTPDYDRSGWMARDSAGSWYLFIVDDGTMDASSEFERP